MNMNKMYSAKEFNVARVFWAALLPVGRILHHAARPIFLLL